MNPGKITEPQCKRSVLKWLPKNQEDVVQGAKIGHSCGIIEQPENSQTVSAMATVSIQTYESEKYAYYNALNKLEASGAVPQAIMVNLMLPARGGEERIRIIVQNLSALCEQYGLDYLGGHTELLEELRAPVVTVIAYGYRSPESKFRMVGDVRPGQSIIVAGTVALEALHMLVSDYWEQLHERYPSNYLQIAGNASSDLSLHAVCQCMAADKATNIDHIYMHTFSTGGIFAGLWELGEGARCGIEVKLKDIPILQETVEICNYFDINPYMAMSGGCAMIVTEQAEEVIDCLEKSGFSAIMIGHTTNQNDRIVKNEEARFLNPPKGDDLYKIYLK